MTVVSTILSGSRGQPPSSVLSVALIPDAGSSTALVKYITRALVVHITGAITDVLRCLTRGYYLLLAERRPPSGTLGSMYIRYLHRSYWHILAAPQIYFLAAVPLGLSIQGVPARTQSKDTIFRRDR